jgi:hypothetical protein
MLNFQPNEVIGKVENVDSMVVFSRVDDESVLARLQLNQLVLIDGMVAGEYLVGMITQITKQALGQNQLEPGKLFFSNQIRIILVGSYATTGASTDFRRTIVTVPNVNAICYSLADANLQTFMSSVSKKSATGAHPLTLGHYALSKQTHAILDGNRLFQRHAVIVGSTGSGKSWTVAKLLEQIADLPSANVIVMDIHGEYGSLDNANIRKLKIAGPLDTPSDNTIFVPYWFLNYEEMLALILQQKETSAQNQVAIFNQLVTEGKRDYLLQHGHEDMMDAVNVEMPVPYNLEMFIRKLDDLDNEMVPGSRGDKKGTFHGTFTKVVERLNIRTRNKRFNFMFGEHQAVRQLNYFNELIEMLMLPGELNDGQGIKVIDFSEVPSDMLPLVVSIVSRLVFTVQQWVDYGQRNPVAIFCDEAHLYMSEKMDDASGDMSLQNFLRIAKEGRKYGVSLVTITQRPSEVSKTILSQSGNFIVMKLTNNEDQNVVKRLVPDNFGSLLDQLPILDVGECIVVGDASILPTKIKIDAPKLRPNSATIDFWDAWSGSSGTNNLAKAITALRKQNKG